MSDPEVGAAPQPVADRAADRPKSRDQALAWIMADPLRAALCGLALLAVGTMLGLSIAGDLDGTGAALLLGLAAVFVFLGSGGQALIGRISKVGPGGIELTLEAGRRVLAMPTIVVDEFGVIGFEAQKLNDGQRWAYHMGSDLILYYEHENVRPKELGGEELQVYRELVRRVGEAALIEEEFSCRKALYLLRHLEEIEPRTAAECFCLGEAYRLAYSEESPKEYLNHAARYLREAATKDDGHASTHWSLGWVYDEQGRYELAVRENERAIELDPELLPIANWNAAVSLLKFGNEEGSLEKLRAIPTGRWWRKIYDDAELQPLRAGTRAAEFEALYQERSAEEKGGPPA